MNILFLLKSFDVGGVEVVTSVLANKFAEEGHQVVLWAFFRHEPTIEDRLRPDVKIIYGQGFSASSSNKISLSHALETYDVDVIINQWPLPPQPTSLLKKVLSYHPAKIISVFHSDPMTNGRLMDIDTNLSRTKNSIMQMVLKMKRRLYQMITSYSMRRSYKMSDLFVVLAESYKQHFVDFTGVQKPNHLISLPNPVTIDVNRTLLSDTEKQKRILYVGRLELFNKRPDRVLQIWNEVAPNAEDWFLDIVGDGPDKCELERMTTDMQLEHVKFYGYQNPTFYYEQSSILLLTSDFEGFPLVLVEGMSYGLVPVVYGSFSAVYDIIEDGKDGIIVPKGNEGFNADVMAERIKPLMANHDKLNYMALNAIEKSKNYSIDKIYEQWMEIIDKMKK